jgi:hypothetical protein
VRVRGAGELEGSHLRRQLRAEGDGQQEGGPDGSHAEAPRDQVFRKEAGRDVLRPNRHNASPPPRCAFSGCCRPSAIGRSQHPGNEPQPRGNAGATAARYSPPDRSCPWCLHPRHCATIACDPWPRASRGSAPEPWLSTGPTWLSYESDATSPPVA